MSLFGRVVMVAGGGCGSGDGDTEWFVTMLISLAPIELIHTIVCERGLYAYLYCISRFASA